MKFRIKDILAVVFLLIVGAVATTVYRANYTNPASKPDTTLMSPEEFVSLCDSSEERAFFFIRDKHARKFENILSEDTVESIFIVKDKHAVRYDTTYPLINLGKFSGMDNKTVVETVINNGLSGFDLVKDKDSFRFEAEVSGNEVKIDISSESTKKGNDFIQTVPDDEIVKDLTLDGSTYCGYLHQSSNVDRFLKYQVIAILTPEN